MKFLTLLSNKTVHLSPKVKRVPQEDFSELLDAKELLEKIHEEEKVHRQQISDEGKAHFEASKKRGFDEGMHEWAKQIKHLEDEGKKVRSDLQKFLVKIALATAKKIVGREIEQDPSTLADIVMKNLKSVSSHKKITIFANKNDLDVLNENRDRLKGIFDQVESFVVQARDDVHEGGVIIETEAGIVDARSEVLWSTIEKALDELIDKK